MYLYRQVYWVARGALRLAGPARGWLQGLGNRINQAAQRRLVKRSGNVPNPLTFRDHRFYHNGRASWTVFGMFLGTYEKETFELLSRLLEPGMTFVDLGAHIGCYTVIAASLVGRTGRVYAFEPHPENAELLRRNVLLNDYGDRVKVVRKAVADFSGEAVLVIDVEDSGSHRMAREQNNRLGASLVVEVTTLDDFFAREGWPKVDVIKMDIEGAEIAALQGMSELSRRNSDLKLIVEFGPRQLTAAGGVPKAFFSALEAGGFTSFFLIDRELVPISAPQEIPDLTRRAGEIGVNLLCKRS